MTTIFGTISLFLLFLMVNVDLKAQEVSRNDAEFPIGAFIASKNIALRHGSNAWNSVDSSGMNTFIQYVDDITKGPSCKLQCNWFK